MHDVACDMRVFLWGGLRLRFCGGGSDGGNLYDDDDE